MSNLGISYTDAFFESMSAITTTGSTVLSRLDSLPYGILLWRSIIQWIGGIGLVAFAILLLPALRVGGMQLFQTESSDKSEKLIPRSADIMRHLLVVYTGLTVLCALSFYLEGMTLFDAINHAMTTIPTGGFSTHDASFGYFDSISMRLTATVFMFISGIPFILYIQFFYQKKMTFLQDEQVIVYCSIVFGLTVIMTAWIWNNEPYDFMHSFSHAIFSIVSIMTTTGYATVDYTVFGTFATMFFFFLTYVGACAGSTAGGMKIMRLSIVSKAVSHQINTMIYSRGLFPIRYQGKAISRPLVNVVLGFSGLYVLFNVLLTLALSLIGLDFATAISGAATAIANVGPGIGDIIGPAGNFSSLPDSAKWLLSLGMLIGRLEILTVLVLFTPAYWRF
tara:strand:- start:2632 stop:3810 length:1179 start_codon:yes stop_codon:yes gene_type:complete